MKINTVWSLVLLAVIALVASVAPVHAEDGGTVAIPGKYRDVFFRNPEAAAAYAAATTCEGRADAIAKAAIDCNGELSSCLERERVANETSQEYSEMYAKEYAQCHGIRCTPEEVKAKNPKCFPKGTSSPKPPPKVAVKYCQDLDPVLDAVAGSGVIGESDVVIVRSLSETGGVATVKCVPSYIAVQNFVKYVRAEFGKVCYKRTPESEAKLTEEERKELDEQCGVAGSRIKWTGDTLDGFENLTPEVWADVYAAFVQYLVELGKINADIEELKARVGKLKARMDANDVTDEDQWRHINALEHGPMGKRLVLQLSVEAGAMLSEITDTPFVGARMDLIARPNLKSGFGGCFGLSGGRGFTGSVGGIEQPDVVTYAVRLGPCFAVVPKAQSSKGSSTTERPATSPETGESSEAAEPSPNPNVLVLRLDGSMIGAWPIESHQNISAAGVEAGLDWNYKSLVVGLGLGFYNGQVARYERFDQLGGAVDRTRYGDTLIFKPTIHLGGSF